MNLLGRRLLLIAIVLREVSRLVGWRIEILVVLVCLILVDLHFLASLFVSSIKVGLPKVDHRGGWVSLGRILLLHPNRHDLHGRAGILLVRGGARAPWPHRRLNLWIISIGFQYACVVDFMSGLVGCAIGLILNVDASWTRLVIIVASIFDV